MTPSPSQPSLSTPAAQSQFLSPSPGQQFFWNSPQLQMQTQPHEASTRLRMLGWDKTTFISTIHNRDHQPTVVPPGTSMIIEWAMLDHLIDLHFTLLEVGMDELKDPPTMEASTISPSASDQEFIAFQENEKAGGFDVEKKSPNKISSSSTKTLCFWICAVYTCVVAGVPCDQDTSLGLLLRRNPDDDGMTESTSGTDDDPVRDAFKLLNMSEDIVDENEQDDEIGWDPRATISPALSASLRATPLTPIKPMLSPKALSLRSATHYLPATPSTFRPHVALLPAPATTQ
ncbi:hypothetical protein BDZ97DRAFT_2079118 [Flammula alnicola]|nr:hypothetical protein BDZ97DRAFT_2079118 [Flammula alnicola]